MTACYQDSLENFIGQAPDLLIGKLTIGLAREGFDTNTLTTFSWQQEISELQTSLRQLTQLLPDVTHWTILLEYTIPIIGQRVDCVLLAHDVVFVIEYKGGHSASARSALLQAQEYALNLQDFHESSRGRSTIPIAVGAFKTSLQIETMCEHQGAALPPAQLADFIVRGYKLWGGKKAKIEADAWNNSRYFPVPTIIEAASSIYRNHTVKNLAYSRAGIDNLEITQKAVVELVQDARQRNVKKLIVITGVPGAGKTLAGLNAVQQVTSQLNLETEQASFLSGNSPLVAVLQTALKRDIGSRKKGVARSVQSRVREVHRFVRDTYESNRPPADRLIIFDEAQRSWTAAKNKKKFGRDISEPEMVLKIMGRHEGWAVIIALVGGGQEIHGGEAGLAAWGDAITTNGGWEVITSPEAVLGGPSVAGSRLFREGQQEAAAIQLEPALHLAISKRSFETEVTAAWVNAVLDGRVEEAKSLSSGGLPIYLTRNLGAARAWLRLNTAGNRRAGLIASSGATRLRTEGVEPPTFNFLSGIDYVKWFLEPSGNYLSSNQLEVAMSEFEMQGLEIDLAALLWGGDLVFPEGKVVTRVLKRSNWTVVSGRGDPQASADDPRIRIQNKYRVLLTRFRKSMVIFVPQGIKDDSTCASEDFDSVYDYLRSCGIRDLPGE